MDNLKLNHFEHKTLILPESTEEMLREFDVKSFEGFRKEELSIPPIFTLRGNMSAVQNQSYGGFCTAFCTSSNLEYVHNRIHLSESCLNHEAETRWGDCAEGLATVHAYHACKNVGVVAHSDWPYNPSLTCWNPAPNVNGKPRYKFGNFANIFNRPSSAVIKNMVELYNNETTPLSPPHFVRLLKEAIVNWNVPASIDVPVWWESHGHFEAGWENGPDIHMPTPVQLKTWLEYHGISTEKNKAIASPPNVSGWHCISICGFDDTKGRFIFKNSWASWWGDQGYGTIPYDYITAFSRSGFIGK